MKHVSLSRLFFLASDPPFCLLVSGCSLSTSALSVLPVHLRRIAWPALRADFPIAGELHALRTKGGKS